MDYIVVPIELCKYALMERKSNQLRLYIFLKSKCSGHLKLPKERIDDYCKELGFKSTKTFKSNLNWLLRNKWITVNTKSGNYQIKGFSALALKLDFSCVKGAIFEPMDFTKFKSFSVAAVITYYMIKKSGYDKERSERFKGRSRMNRLKVPAFYTLPHSYLAKVLNIPKSTAENYRKMAIDAKFIKIKHCYTKLDIPTNQIKLFKRYNESDSHFRVFTQKLHKQNNDQIISNIMLRTKYDLKKKFKRNGKFSYR